MSGYLYIIRRALSEYKKDPIYKIGRTENANPHKYLRHRYDPHYAIHLLERTSNVRVVEKDLIKTLNNDVRFKRVHGLETFQGDLNIMKDLVYKRIAIELHHHKSPNTFKRIRFWIMFLFTIAYIFYWSFKRNTISNI